MNFKEFSPWVSWLKVMHEAQTQPTHRWANTSQLQGPEKPNYTGKPTFSRHTPAQTSHTLPGTMVPTTLGGHCRQVMAPPWGWGVGETPLQTKVISARTVQRSRQVGCLLLFPGGFPTHADMHRCSWCEAHDAKISSHSTHPSIFWLYLLLSGHNPKES